MGAVHLLPGTTQSNPQEKGAYDSEGRAALTLPELERWLLEIAGVYHLSVHSTLGKTPLLPAVPRIIQRDGVHFHGIRYWDSVLSPWAGRLKKPLWIKYDPRNLARVYVRDSNGKHWPVPYADLRQPPIALWELMEARKRLRQSGKADPTERALSANILQQLRLVKEAVSQSQQRRRKERIPSIVEIQPTGAEAGRSDRVSYDIQAYPFEIWERE